MELCLKTLYAMGLLERDICGGKAKAYAHGQRVKPS